MLKIKIEKDFQKVLKERKEIEISTLRMLKAAIFNKEKEKRYKLSQAGTREAGAELKKEELEKESQLMDDEVIEVLSSEIKKRKEALILFERGTRKDLAKKEKAEMKILQNYLPEQFSEEEIRKLIEEAIKKTGAKEIKDMGKVMSELMPKVKGKADGSLVSKIVKEVLISKND